MSLLAAGIVKNKSYLGWSLLHLSEKRPKANLRVFRYQILTSVKRSVKQLASKATFTTFLRSCFNFRLILCERPYSYKSCKGN